MLYLLGLTFNVVETIFYFVLNSNGFKYFKDRKDLIGWLLDHKFITQQDRWGYDIYGYLKIEEWAYALALFTFLREEDKPEWKQYLSTSIRSDFERSLEYMIENEDQMFKSDEQ